MTRSRARSGTRSAAFESRWRVDTPNCGRHCGRRRRSTRQTGYRIEPCLTLPRVTVDGIQPAGEKSLAVGRRRVDRERQRRGKRVADHRLDRRRFGLCHRCDFDGPIATGCVCQPTRNLLRLRNEVGRFGLPDPKVRSCVRARGWRFVTRPRLAVPDHRQCRQ